MKSLLLVIGALALTVGLATAQQDPHCYGWEDGGTVLGAYLPDLMYLANTDAEAFEGSSSLEIYKNASGSTPQAYVAWVTGLQEGDEVSASVMTLDLIEGNPSVRIWGHWTAVDGSIDDYAGSAGGNDTYSGGEGWVELTHAWTVPADRDGQGLVIEIRPYNGDPYEGSNWVDQLCVSIPTGAWLYFPGGTVAAEGPSWTAVKSLFR
jgi:hypothetical protein